MSFQKSTRVGYTQILLAYLGYRRAHDPGNLLLARPTIEDTKKFMKEHVAAAFSWPIMKLNGLFSTRTAQDTLTEKYFPGGSLKGIGANSPGGFRDHDADAVISDEIDGWPVTAGVEGDQMNLIAERLAQAYDPKDIAGSTPTEEAISKISKRMASSDQRHYWVTCPEPTCKQHQKLVWGNGKKDEPGLRWEPFNEPTEVWYQCVNGCRIPESKKLWMLQNGFWKAEFPEVYERTGHAGFFINALYSLQPNAKWPDLVEKFLGSYKTPSKFKTFVNTTLGETWKVSGERPDWQRLLDRRDDWKAGIVPFGGCFLTAAVDVQAGGGGRLEVFVIAHGRGGSTWLVEHMEFMGSPYEPKVWDQLTEFARRKWAHEKRQRHDADREDRSRCRVCHSSSLQLVPKDGSELCSSDPWIAKPDCPSNRGIDDNGACQQSRFQVEGIGNPRPHDRRPHAQTGAVWSACSGEANLDR